MTANATVVKTVNSSAWETQASGNILGEPCEERHRGGQKNPQENGNGQRPGYMHKVDRGHRRSRHLRLLSVLLCQVPRNDERRRAIHDWREFCSKGKKIVAALNQLCGEASLLAKNPELLNVTKYCIEGADMLRSIADIWDLVSGVAEDNEERSFAAAFHQDTPVGEVYKEFISDEPTRILSSRRRRSSKGMIEELRNSEIEAGGRYSR